MSDHEILFPEPVVVAFGRRRVKIRPVQMRHFELFGAATRSLLSYLQSGSVSGLAEYAVVDSKSLRRALAATTNLTRLELALRPAPQLIQLYAMVLKANAGFFAQAQLAVAKQLDGLL